MILLPREAETEGCCGRGSLRRREGGENHFKKVPWKKVSGKKPGNKNFRKKPEFSQVLGNKVLCFGFLELFFPKIVWGLPKKSQEIRSQDIKSCRKHILRKKKPRKNFPNLVKMRSSQRHFYKKDFFMHLYFEYSHECF